MKVSDFEAHELRHALKRDGVYLHIGSYVVHIKSRFKAVAQGLCLIYADYPLETATAFADFHVSIEKPRNLRRWFSPQAIFRFDNFKPFKPLPADQAFPFFEWGLNWCISTQYHKYLVVHAAVIEKNGYAVLLPAPPGSGKSTLCAALVMRGWRLLSDELSLVSLSDGAITPMCRPISLKNASIDIMRQFEPSAVIGPAAYDTSKGTVAHIRAPDASVARSQETAEPAWIIFPQYEAGVEAELNSHPKGSAFMKLAEKSFNYSMLGLDGFNAVTRLVERCACYEFRYSRLEDAIAQFEALFSSAAD